MNKIKIFAMGDFLYIDNIEKDIFGDRLKSILSGTDFNITNFEAPLTQNFNPIKKAGPAIYQQESGLKILNRYNFRLLTLANNHICDYGDKAVKYTLERIKENEINTIGIGISKNQYKEYIFTKEGIKIAFLSVGEDGFGANSYNESFSKNEYKYDWINSIKLIEKIIELNTKVDSIILFVHAGLEDVPIPLDIWRKKYKELCELGVKLIIGHHPHVPQGMEEYKGSKIFYSLGNSYFDFPKEKELHKLSYGCLIEIDTFTKEIKVDRIPLRMGEKLEVYHDDSYLNYLTKLDKALCDSYTIFHEIQLESYYKNIYLGYLKLCLGSNKILVRKIKKILKQILILLKLRKQDKDNNHLNLILAHLFFIESHSFSIQFALRNKNDKQDIVKKKEYLKLLNYGEDDE
ncbi:MAG: CapA family protein [Fusobacteriaceae bacterium]|nr:CapA family protein [Fusobacteriaceae bacterium]